MYQGMFGERFLQILGERHLTFRTLQTSLTEQLALGWVSQSLEWRGFNSYCVYQDPQEVVYGHP